MANNKKAIPIQQRNADGEWEVVGEAAVELHAGAFNVLGVWSNLAPAGEGNDVRSYTGTVKWTGRNDDTNGI